MATLKNDMEKNEEIFQNYYQPSLNCPNCPMYTCPYYTAPSFSNQQMRSEAQSFDELQTNNNGFRQRRPMFIPGRRRPFFPIRPFVRPFIRPFFIRPFYPPYMYPDYDYDYDYYDHHHHDHDYYWDQY